MTKQRLRPPAHPPRWRAYSQAIDADGYVYCAGQLGLDPATGQLVRWHRRPDRACAPQPGRRARRGGLTTRRRGQDDLLPDRHRDFAAFNEVYVKFFTEPPPARSTFAVAALPKGARVEIEAVAVRSVD